MFELSFTGQFRKDYKKILKSTLDTTKLEAVFDILTETGTLPFDKYKTHLLKGNYKGHHEAHIEPDWLVIWLKKDNEISLVRTGSHSELF